MEKRLLNAILFLSLPLLFFPKINLVSFDDHTAGLRIDDLVLFGLGVFFLAIFIARNRFAEGLEKWVLLITLTSFISFSVNQVEYFFGLIHVKSSIFYVLRLPEYFIFFYLGIFCFRLLDLKKVLLFFLLFNAFLMFLQKGGVLGQITVMGNLIDTNRVSGIASFPSEMGALLSMIFCYFLFDNENKSSLIGLFYFMLFFLLIIMTGSRVPLAVITLVFICYQFKNAKSYVLLFGSALIFPIIFYVMMSSDSIFERSLNLFSFDNLSIVSKIWDFINIDRELYDNIKLESGDFDMSWLERCFKWCYALKMYIHHPECYLLVSGPVASHRQ